MTRKEQYPIMAMDLSKAVTVLVLIDTMIKTMGLRLILALLKTVS